MECFFIRFQNRPESLPLVTALPDGRVILTPMSISGHSNIISSPHVNSARHSKPTPTSVCNELRDSPSPAHSCYSCDSSCSCSSCVSDCKKSDENDRVEKFAYDVKIPFNDDEVGTYSEECHPVCDHLDCQTREGCMHSDSGCQRKPLHLENIDDLIRQIDEHVNKMKNKQKDDWSGVQGNPAERTHLLNEVSHHHDSRHMYSSPLSINIPHSPSNELRKALELPIYSSSPPPVIEERSPKRTSSLQTYSHVSYPICGISPVYIQHTDTPTHPPSYNSLLESISSASTIQCSPNRVDRSPIPYCGTQQLGPALHHHQQTYGQTNSTSSGSRTNSPPILFPQQSPPHSHSIQLPLTGDASIPATPNKPTYQQFDDFPMLDASVHTNTPDMRSTSEGYHSDKLESHDFIITRQREIPRLSSSPSDANPVKFTHRKSAVYV